MADPIVAPIVNGSASISIDSKTLEQCLKNTSRFGETVYYNICTGTNTSVPWGGADWLLCVFLMTLGLIVVGVGVAFVWWMFFGEAI